MKAIKEMVEEIRRDSYNVLDVGKATFLLQRLSALLGNIVDEYIDAEMIYNRYFEKMSDEFDKITEARVKAKASQEYENMLRAQGFLETTKDLINSLKYVVKQKQFEQENSRFQK